MRTSNTNISDDIHLLNKRKKDIDSLYEESDAKKYKMSNGGESGTTSTHDDSTNYLSYINKKVPNNLEEWLTMFYNWSHSERISALDSLVTSEICEVQQMRHLLSLIEPQLQRDFISLLPKELSLYVLSFLDPSDLLRAAQTCRYWHILCEDNLLWREKCRDEGLLEDNETFSDLFRKRISSTNSNSCSNYNSVENTLTPFSPTQTNQAAPSNQQQQNFQRSEYKLSYLRHKSIEYNWRYGILNYNANGDDQISAINHNQIDNDDPSDNSNQFAPSLQPPNDSKLNISPALEKKCKLRRLKEVLHLKGHEDHVITCLQFNPTSNIIVSGSDDNTLKVWSSVTGRCLRTLYGHTGGVWSSQLSQDNVVISGSTDRTLRVWNALNGQCLHTLYGHTSTVRCMALHGKHVVSGSRDATLRVWNIESGECDHVLVGHVAAVRCVQFNGSLCVSGAYDYLVKVWDVASETCLHTLEGHTNRVYSLQFDGKHIVSGSLDTSIRVWSSETGKLKHTLIGHQSLTSGMQLRSNILVSGNADSTVKVWDINTGQCLQTLSGVDKHQSAVTCLQFNSKFVITSSDDGTVKLWDLKTGEFIRNLVSLPSGGSGGVVWRIRASNTKLVCAVGSRNGTEETKLLVLDFETPNTNYDFDTKTLSSWEFFNWKTQSPMNLFSDSNDVLHSKSTSSSCLNQFSSCHTHSPTFNNFQQPENQELASSDAKSQIQTQAPTSSLSASASSSALSSLSSTPSSSQMVLPSISLAASLQSISSTSTAPSKSCTIKQNCEMKLSSSKSNQSDKIVDNILKKVNDIISQPTSVENNYDEDMDEDDS